MIETSLCNQFTGPVAPTDALCSDGAGAIAPGVADLTTKLEISGASYNFSSVITTTPSESTVAFGPGHPSNVAANPDLGDIMGQLVSATNLGLTNGACATPLDVPFKFINATVDNSLANDIHPIAAAAAGSQGTLENHQSDQAAAATAGIGADATIPLNGLSAAVDRYPSYLNATFDPDWISYGPNEIPYDGDDVNGAAPPVQPVQRLSGSTIVSGTAVQLELVIFAPGALASAFPKPHPFSDLVSEMGFTTATVLQNPTAPAAPGAITDFCAGLSTITTVFGESRENPCNGNPALCDLVGEISDPAIGANTTEDRYATPAAANTYGYYGYAASLRDTDGDGFENALDTCATSVNTQNPKLTSGADADMIDPSCDPTPAGDTGAGNHDGDVAPNGGVWLNAGDNCPLASNGTQLESELNQAYNVSAPQGGPKTDAIGDACDADDVEANGDYLADLSLSAKCIGGTDADGDGYCNPLGPAPDPNDANFNIRPETFNLVLPFAVAGASAGDNPPERSPVQVCNDGLDNDGDGLVDGLDAAAGTSTCRPVGLPSVPAFPTCPKEGCAVDSDGDGFGDEVERYLGTGALGRCGVGAVPNPSPQYPADFVSGGIPNSTDKVTITDITSFTAIPRKFNTNPSDANFNVRWDLAPGPGILGTYININDLTALTSLSSTGSPAMYEGTKAFNNILRCDQITPNLNGGHPVYGE